MVDKFLPKFKNELNNQKDKEIVVLPMMNSSILKYISKKYKISTGDYVFVYEKENINKAHFQRYLIPEEAD